MEITKQYYNHATNTIHIEANYTSTGTDLRPEVYITIKDYFDKYWTPDASELDDETILELAVKGIFAYRKLASNDPYISVNTESGVNYMVAEIPLSVINNALDSSIAFASTDLFVCYTKFNVSLNQYVYAWKNTTGTTTTFAYTNKSKASEITANSDVAYVGSSTTSSLITAVDTSANTITIGDSATAGTISTSNSVVYTRSSSDDKDIDCGCGTCYAQAMTYDRYVVESALLKESVCAAINRDNKCGADMNFITKLLINDTLMLAIKYNDIKHAFKCFDVISQSSSSTTTTTCNCNA